MLSVPPRSMTGKSMTMMAVEVSETQPVMLSNKYKFTVPPFNPVIRLPPVIFIKELSVPEIAQQTGKNPKTVQTQLYRARAMLKKMLERGD